MDLPISDLFNIPLPYLFAVLTGYVLASLLAEDTSFWRNRESFEKLIIGGALGVGLLFGVTLPFVLLASLWIPLTIEQAFQQAGYLLFVCFLFAPLSARIGKVSKERILTIFGNFVLIFPYAFMLEVGFAFILTRAVTTYPDYLRLTLQPFWNSFMAMSVLSFVLSTLNLVIFQIFVTPLWARNQREIPRVDMRWGQKARKGWSQKFSYLKWSFRRRLAITRMRLFTKKKGIVVLGLILVVLTPLMATSLDQNIFFLTPRLQVSEEKPLTGSFQRRELILTRVETFEGGVSQFVYQFYELRYRGYNVTIPSFPYHVNSICLTNPSNFSKELDTGRSYGYLSSWGDIDNLWILSSDNNASFTYRPDSKQVKEMTVDFSNTTGKMIGFNITYYQQFPVRNVSVQEDPAKLGEYQNNTRLESYYFYIQNNENATLKIPYFEFQRLIFEVVDIDSVRVYMNNQLHPEVTVDRSAIYPWMIVPPYGTGNLTITLISRTG